jgi:hypothetical protein
LSSNESEFQFSQSMCRSGNRHLLSKYQGMRCDVWSGARRALVLRVRNCQEHLLKPSKWTRCMCMFALRMYISAMDRHANEFAAHYTHMRIHMHAYAQACTMGCVLSYQDGRSAS